MWVMTPMKSLSPSVRAYPARIDRLLSAVEQRLASAERELRIQFTRIAQLQAELDHVLAGRRRSSNRPLAMSCARRAEHLSGSEREKKELPAAIAPGGKRRSHWEDTMSVARVTEITSSSSKSFDDALRVGLARANKTLENVTGAWIKDQEVVAQNGKITEYRVRMKITFVLKAWKANRGTKCDVVP
jgi:flavin-binding protein dodecin